jgi:hypothetical protein
LWRKTDFGEISAMSRATRENRFAEIVAVVGKHPKGVSLIDIAVVLNPPLPLQNLQRWLSVFVRQKQLVRIGRTTSTRYQLPPSPKPETSTVSTSPVTQGVHALVTMPLSERLPAEYRRAMLERYRPNETYYLSEDAQCARPGGAGHGSGR